MLAQRLEIVFNADHDLRQRVEAARFHELDDVVTLQIGQQAIDHGNRARLIEQLHRAARLFHHRDTVIDIFAVARILDELDDRILGFLDVVESRGHHRAEDAVELVIPRYARTRSRFLGAAHRLALRHLVQGLFDLYQLGGHGKQLLFLRRLVAVEDILDDFDLRLDQLALRAQSDHRQRIGDHVHLLR